MNEHIRISLTSNGQPLPLALVEGGIVLHGESSAVPRRVLIEFDGFGDATRARMRFVQARENWHPHTFPLRIHADNGALVVEGAEASGNAETLPPGLYICRLVIDDVQLKDKGRFRIEIKQNRGTDVELAATEDGRQVRLTRGIAELPAGIARVLSAPQSRLDDLQAIDWLNAMTPRASRKACLLNVLAKLAAIREPLLDTVDSLLFADVDRIYTEVRPELAALARRLADDPAKPFFAEGSPKAPVHLRMLKHAQVSRDDYELASYRQQGRNCLQIIVASPLEGRGDRHFAEFDIDLGNPLQDIAGFIVHLGELANPSRTDHFSLRDKLLKSTTRDFVCYDIVEPHVEVRVLDV
jgi:hypothetical protein